MRYCSFCGVVLNESNTYKAATRTCKNCQLQRESARRSALRASGRCVCGQPADTGFKSCGSCREKGRDRGRSLTALRASALVAYGNKCECCGEQREAFLTIDHVVPYNEGGGPRGLRGGGALYGWLHRNAYPEGFRVLCMNCNWSRGVNRYCPHTVELGYADFSCGGASHIYVQMNSKTKKAMDKVLAYCRVAREDINDFMAGIIEEMGKKALKEVEKSKKEAEVLVTES